MRCDVSYRRAFHDGARCWMQNMRTSQLHVRIEESFRPAWVACGVQRTIAQSVFLCAHVADPFSSADWHLDPEAALLTVGDLLAATEIQRRGSGGRHEE